MTIKRIIFIRPGETEWNRMQRQQGWVAVPLNEHGQLQAERLANFIRNIGVGGLYSSDLKRAVDTAVILGRAMGLEPAFDERLRERHIGEWQGLTLQEIQTWYPADYKQLRDNVSSFKIPRGESRQEVAVRALAALEDILKRDDLETVGIISHTVTIRMMLSRLVAGCDSESIRLSNISVTTIMRDDPNSDAWKLVEINDISHLEGLETNSVTEPEA